jgi:hypothetical protein
MSMKSKEPREFSSPACYLHEFESAPPPSGWEEIKRWRKSRREELIAIYGSWRAATSPPVAKSDSLSWSRRRRP